MANEKEMIKKLFAIVQKQQKIIVKMAQGTPTFVNAVAPLLPQGVTVTEARATGDGGLAITLKKPANLPGSPGSAVVSSLVGKTITDDSGKEYQVTDDKFKIQVQTAIG